MNIKIQRVSKILLSKPAIICFTLILIQQVIVASSSIWLKNLSEDVYSSKSLWTNLGLYMMSSILPYFPGGLSVIAITFWQQDSLKKFIESFIDKYKFQPIFWNQKDTRDLKIAVLSKEGQETISSFIEYMHSLFSCTLNAGLNILVLSFIIDKNFIYGYTFSILITAILMKYSSTRQGKIAVEAQDARISIGGILLLAWDNITLGNSYNFQNWLNRFDKAFTRSRSLNIRNTIYQTTISILIAILTMLPCIAIAIYSLAVHLDDKAYVTTIILTFPRLFSILNFTYELLNLLTSFSIHKSQLNGVINNIYNAYEANMPSRINWSKLMFSIKEDKIDFHSIEEVLALPSKSGRITIRGENGAGKSTLLLFMQQELLSRSFYLPAQHHLSFESATANCSTGEALKSQIQEIFTSVEAEWIFLDEWDANLDKSNKSEISKLIDSLAETKIVFEVRHH